jgi:hypothetical protein
MPFQSRAEIEQSVILDSVDDDTGVYLFSHCEDEINMSFSLRSGTEDNKVLALLIRE